MMHEHTLPPPIILEPSQPAHASIIWLHGLGADGNDFVPIVPALQLPKELAVRFIFPHAPIMPITINQGYKMRAWFDIKEISPRVTIDEAGISQSMQYVNTLIEGEIARGIPSEHIILAGFSQGAVIAMQTGLCYQRSLAGIIALSGFMPHLDQLLQQVNPANGQIPIFMAHGCDDTLVPMMLGKSSYEILKHHGYDITWHEYPMAHGVCPEETHAIGQWIQQVLNPVK